MRLSTGARSQKDSREPMKAVTMEVRDARSKGEDGWLLAHARRVRNIGRTKTGLSVRAIQAPFQVCSRRGLLPAAGPDEPALARGLPASSSVGRIAGPMSGCCRLSGLKEGATIYAAADPWMTDWHRGFRLQQASCHRVEVKDCFGVSWLWGLALLGVLGRVGRRLRQYCMNECPAAANHPIFDAVCGFGA